MKHSLLLISLTGALLITLGALDTGGFLGLPSEAHAEEVRASRSVDIMQAPGEKSGAITRVRAGTLMTVLGRKGRWIQVRVNGRTGWVTRTNVAFAKKKRRSSDQPRHRSFVRGRSKNHRRKGGAAPSDRVGMDVTPGPDDNAKGGRFDSDEDEDEDEDQTFDHDDDHDDDSDDSTFDDDDDDDDSDDDDDDDDDDDSDEPTFDDDDDSTFEDEDEDPTFHHANEEDEDQDDVDPDDHWRSQVLGGIGYSAISQSFSTPKTCALCNYTIATGAFSAGIGGESVYALSSALVLAGELSYRYTRSNPGIRFINPDDGAESNVSFQIHRIDAKARAGYQISKSSGMTIYAQVGYHLGFFGVDQVNDFSVNLPKLQSETLSGFTAGAMFDLPSITQKISLRVGADILARGARVQTRGLEDGARSLAAAMWGHVAIGYRLSKATHLTAQYYFSGATTEWTGVATASMRDHGAAKATRSDTIHAGLFGVNLSF